MPEKTYSELLKTLLGGGELTRAETAGAFGRIMEGAWSEAQIAGLLVALAAKGESVEEIAGAAQAMRAHAVRIDARGADVIDTCGTGGTGLRTFNVSTAAAFVAAGAGVKVAKHGNRTYTRASGSADVLAALGVNLEANAERVADCLGRAGVCFCFAPRCHPAMKYAVPVRKALGVRTVFNLLGPLTNPAGAKRQLMGVFDEGLVVTVAKVLGALGATRAMVVHAADGMDELSTTGPSTIAHWRGGGVTLETLDPGRLGIPAATMGDLLVSSPQESAAVILAVLEGQSGPAREIVALNAAAAVAVAGEGTIEQALPAARESIDSGRARAALRTLVEVSNAG